MLAGEVLTAIHTDQWHPCKAVIDRFIEVGDEKPRIFHFAGETAFGWTCVKRGEMTFSDTRTIQ